MRTDEGYFSKERPCYDSWVMNGDREEEQRQGDRDEVPPMWKQALWKQVWDVKLTPLLRMKLALKRFGDRSNMRTQNVTKWWESCLQACRVVPPPEEGSSEGWLRSQSEPRQKKDFLAEAT